MKRSPAVTFLAAAVAGLVTLSGCSSADPGEQDAELVMAVSYLDVNWDPAQGAIMYTTTMQPVYDKLIAWDEANNTYVPWLAEEYTISDDLLSMEVKLRENVEFIDGEPLDAEAVKASYEMIFDGEGFGPQYRAHLVDEYDTAFTVTGDYTLTISTSLPIRQRYLEIFELVPVASPKALSTPGGFDDGPVGTGPYLVDEIVPDVSISYVRNPDYWNPDAFDFDTIVMKAFSDRVAAANALRTGQINATQVPLEIASSVEADGFTLHRGAGFYWTLFVVDQAGDSVPALGDVRVRRAMNMAFDRATIADTLDHGYGSVTSQPFTAGQQGYVEGGDERYGYDPDAARQLLSEAGYPDGFAIRIPTLGSSDSVEPIVAQSFAEIGIEVEFVPFADYPEYSAAVLAGEFPVTLINAAFANTPYYLTLAGFSPLKAPNPDVLRLIGGIAKGTAEEAEAAAQEFGELVLDEAWYVPFSVQPTLWASTPEIDIFVGDIIGNLNLPKVTLAE